MIRSKDSFLDEQEQDFIMPEYNNTVSIFEQGITKEDIPNVVDSIVESVLEKGNPLEVAEKIRIMELIIEGVKSDNRYKDYALEEIAKYGKRGYVSPSGAKIEAFEAGGQYNFKNCNDPKVIDLEEKLKLRKEFLKKLPAEGLVVTDQTTGETTTIYPAQKPLTTSTYKITISKK